MFPDRSGDIKIYRENAHRFLEEKNYDKARGSFFSWVEMVKQQNINTNGKLEKELEEAKREYSEFAKNDPLYIKICDASLPKIKERPGILQTDLYKLVPQFARRDISYALYFAADHGKVKRIKKGQTYSLSLL